MIVDARVRLPQSLRPPLQADEAAVLADYGAVFDASAATDAPSLLADMDAAGVDHAIVHAEHETGDHADAFNEAVAALVAERPGRLSGFGTITLAPLRPARSLAQLRRAGELGLRGVNVQPAFFDLSIDDRRLYPLYALAEEQGLAVSLHTGVNYSRRHPIRGERPELLDQVACDFPGLTLIACHAGWPWAAEMAAVARRHPTVLFDFGGIAPKYLGQPGSGWEVLMRYVAKLLSGQALFATDWPVIPMARALGEWRELPLSDDALAAVLGGNAARLLGLPPSPQAAARTAAATTETAR